MLSWSCNLCTSDLFVGFDFLLIKLWEKVWTVFFCFVLFCLFFKPHFIPGIPVSWPVSCSLFYFLRWCPLKHWVIRADAPSLHHIHPAYRCLRCSQDTVLLQAYGSSLHLSAYSFLFFCFKARFLPSSFIQSDKKSWTSLGYNKAPNTTMLQKPLMLQWSFTLNIITIIIIKRMRRRVPQQ